MRKILLTIIIILLLNIGLVSAHEHDFAKTKQLIDSGISCDKLTDEQLEAIGDYHMEQMHPGEAHEMMDKMMGGEGSESLKQMHINMAKRLYCNEDVGGMMGSEGMMGMMPMMANMMGSGMMSEQNPTQTSMAQGMMDNPFGAGMSFWNYGYWGISSILYIVLLVGLVALVFLGVFKLWKDINKKEV